MFDSIYKGYSIGNLLLWKTKENLAYRKIGSKKTIKNNNGKELYYILDGQQRLTTIYGVLKGKELYKSGNKKPKEYKIFFDNKTNQFVSDTQKIKVNNVETTVKKLIGTNELDPFRFIDLSQIFDEKLKFPESIIDKEKAKIREELGKTKDIPVFREKDETLDENKKTLEKFTEIIKSYKIHQIVEESDLDKVVTIFERINTQNVKLDIFDIMIAKTYKTVLCKNKETTFNLRNAIQKILYSGNALDSEKVNPEVSLNYEKDSYYNIDPTTTLRLISIIHNKNNPKISGLQKKQIYELQAQYIQDNILEFRKIFEQLLKYLSNELNIKSLDVKYTDNKILSFLTYVICLNKYSELNQKNYLELINQWFWNTLIFNRYPGAQLQGIETDMLEFDKGVNSFCEQIKNNRNLGIFNKKYEFSNTYLINAGYNKQNNLYSSLILLLNCLKPVDFNANSEVNLMEYFGPYTKNNKHHIIPFNSNAANKLRKDIGREKAEFLLNNIANIAIISSELNQEIKKQNPEDYFVGFESTENFQNILKTHLIDNDMYNILVKEKNYEEFLIQRTKKIIDLIIEKCKIGNEKINLLNNNLEEDENDNRYI